MMNNDAPAYARDSFAFGKLIDYLLPFMAKDGLTSKLLMQYFIYGNGANVYLPYLAINITF
jgi:hypothetical protein